MGFNLGDKKDEHPAYLVTDKMLKAAIRAIENRVVDASDTMQVGHREAALIIFAAMMSVQDIKVVIDVEYVLELE